MDTTIYQALLPRDDPDASLAFYRDTLGFEIRNDVEWCGMHWITVGPPHTNPERPSSCTCRPPPGITDDERRTIVQEPTDQPYGLRDCAFRDAAGNLIRIQELR